MSMFSRLSSKMFGAADANQRSTPALPAKYDEFTTTSVSTDEPASADDISTGAESADTFAHEPSADLEMTAEEPPCDSEGQAVEDSAANEGEDMAGGESLEGDEAGEQLNEGGVVDESDEQPGQDDNASGELIPAQSCDSRGSDGDAHKPKPPSHSADAQQLRRARKRYREDAQGHWIKGKEARDGNWTPEIGAQSFSSLGKAVAHERQKLQLRRCSWSNLRSAVATTKSAVMTEGLETRRLVASESASTRQHVTSTSNALGEKLGAKIEEGVERMLNSAKQSRESTTNPGQVAFFSRLMAGFKAVELKELLVEHRIEPIGTKQTFAELIVGNLTQDDVNAFLTSRGSHNKRQRLATGQQRMGGGEGRQSTMDLFARQA